MEDTINNLLGKLKTSFLIRSLFVGIIIGFITSIFYKSIFEYFISYGLFSVILLFCIGNIVYTIHRYIIGDLLLYRIQMWFCYCYEKLFLGNNECISILSFFNKEFGVSYRNIRSVYVSVYRVFLNDGFIHGWVRNFKNYKKNDWNATDKFHKYSKSFYESSKDAYNSFENNHIDIHILYITSELLIAVSLLSLWFKADGNVIYAAYAGIILLMLALLIDAKQQFNEVRHFFRVINSNIIFRNKLSSFIAYQGYILHEEKTKDFFLRCMLNLLIVTVIFIIGFCLLLSNF